MSVNRRWRVGISLMAIVGWPALATAQSPAPDLPVAIGHRVWVTTSDGLKTKGTIFKMTPASVEIDQAASGRVSLAVADIRRIQSPDPVRNGVVKGAVGLGLAGLAFGAILKGTHDAYDDREDGRTALIASTAAGVTSGALLGYALDATKVRTTYEHPAGGAAQSASLAPGKTITVAAIDGSTIEGTLVTWSADAIAIRTEAGVRTMPMADVQQVSTTRTHGLAWAKKGGLWGSALGLLATAFSGEPNVVSAVVFVGAPAALWGGIFGASHRTLDVVFDNKTTTRIVVVAPILTPSRFGFQGVVQW